MIETKAEYRDDADGLRTPRKPRTWSLLTAVVGAIAAFVSMSAAHGNGWSPLIFILLGLFGTPLLAKILWRRKRNRPWSMRLIALLSVSALSFGLAKYSTRIDPLEAHQQILQTKPPVGVTLLEARQQWYDGRTVIVSFTSTIDFAQLIRLDPSFQDESRDEPTVASTRVLIPFLDTTDLMPAEPVQWRHWRRSTEDAAGKHHQIDILWDPAKSRGVIVGNWD